MAFTSSKRAKVPTTPSRARIAPCMCRRTRNLSGDVGEERILDPRDQVLELELAFLESRQLELITSRRAGHRHDRRIQVAMLLAKLQELGFQSLFFFVGHGQAPTDFSPSEGRIR